MAKFEISFVPQALDDIFVSYEWGIKNWGEDAAEKWLRELHHRIYDRLTLFPASCALAPENSEWEGEVRQLLFLRYRVLFEIVGNLVVILRVDGPYKGEIDDTSDN